MWVKDKSKFFKGDKMIYRQFKDIKLSMLGMGNMRLPKIDPNDRDSLIDHKEAQKIIDKAMAGGINYYDTAYVYGDGDSECFLGEAMQKFPRDSYYLATKFNYRANPNYKEVFETELKRLKTDHIDFYLLHCMTERNIEDYLNCGCIEYFEQMQREGKITYFGFSSHANPETLRRFASVRKWDFCQLMINYFDWKYSTAEEEYNIVTELGIPVMVMEPVRGGRLSSLTPELDAKLKAAQPSWSISSWALRWMQAHDNVRVILSGMSTPDQMDDNLITFGEENALNPEQMKFLEDIADEFKKGFTVPCTACRYCTPNCPMKLDIPALLKVYNDYKFERRWENFLKNWDADKLPSNCIGCGSCMEHCPQNIDIPSYMAKLAKLHETGKEE